MKTSIILILCSMIVTFVLTNTIAKKIWRYWKHRHPSTLQPISNAVVQSNGAYTNIIFLHHSTGRHLVTEGRVREQLSEKGYLFWDHDYNSIGLTNPQGEKLNLCYDIPSDTTGNRGNGNTNPEGLSILFNQPVHNPQDNAFSRLLQHDVIIFKSCFPNSAIKSEQMLDQYKKWFLGIREIIDQHPDKIFIPFTLPPLHPLATNTKDAECARQWANWLKSPEFLDGYPNIFVFDLFDLLADSSTNMLHHDYQKQSNKQDSHPNRKANRTIGPILVDFIDTIINVYRDKNNNQVNSPLPKKDIVVNLQDTKPPSQPQNLRAEFVLHK